MGDPAVLAGVQHREVRIEASGDVVGVEHGHRAGVGETGCAHQGDVHPRDRQDRCRADRRSGNGTDWAAGRCQRMSGKELGEVSANSDRADTRPAATVRDAERLVQVEVADVGAELAGLGQADHRVEVGAVDVHLSAVAVDDLAQLTDVGLEHPVRRRVRDHRRGQCVAGSGSLCLEVGKVDVALRVAAHDDHLQAGHHGAGRVGAVRARRDQAHVPARVAAAAVVGADRQQAGELALAAGIGLQADRVVAGDRQQHRLRAGRSSRGSRPSTRRG